ncbi:hypothetical protein NDU88_000376 [Pleurodeles waltl]|uniref:Uncharacterized protein n=1 Tax=Pleurodeles waltl TaxID=8319 RepID=A0AAV7VX81_PLEWA|nr:hypothetical protein NDU88_000376 [Pleurodeles waltl]
MGPRVEDASGAKQEAVSLGQRRCSGPTYQEVPDLVDLAGSCIGPGRTVGAAPEEQPTSQEMEDSCWGLPDWCCCAELACWGVLLLAGERRGGVMRLAAIARGRPSYTALHL